MGYWLLKHRTPKTLVWGWSHETIKDISKTNKVGQFLTQRYQPTVNWGMFSKTGKFFLFDSYGISKEKAPSRIFIHICLTNKSSQSIGSTRTAPRIFLKLMKPVLSSLRKRGHQVMNYLDDFLLVCDTTKMQSSIHGIFY